MVNKLPKFLLMSAMLTMLLLPLQSHSQSVTKEYQVRAAIIYKIINFVSWPHKFEGRESFNMCFTGEDNFYDALDKMQTLKAKGLGIKVAKNVATKKLVDCDMVYVGNTYQENLENIIELLKEKPILLIGENSSFAQKGGLIRLYKFEGKIKFDINLESVEKSGLTISSDMIKSAKKLYKRRKNGSKQ